MTESLTAAQTRISGVHDPASARRRTELSVTSGSISGEEFQPFRPEPLSIAVDDPLLRGGDDSALTPMETVLAALAGSFGLITSHCAATVGVTYSRIEIDLEAEYDSRGVRGDPTIFPGYTAVRVRVNVYGAAPADRCHRLGPEVERRSPPLVMLRAAIPVDVVWDFHPSRARRLARVAWVC